MCKNMEVKWLQLQDGSLLRHNIADQPVEMGCHLGKREHFRKKTKTPN